MAKNPVIDRTTLNMRGLNQKKKYNMGVSKNGGTPKWMVKIMENPMNKWMIWGENPLFSETSICFSRKLHSFLETLWLSPTLRPPPVRVLVGSPKRDILEAWCWRNWHTNKQQQSHPKWWGVRTLPPKKLRPSDYFDPLRLFLGIFRIFKIRGTLELRWKRGSMSWLRWPSLD